MSIPHLGSQLEIELKKQSFDLPLKLDSNDIGEEMVHVQGENRSVGIISVKEETEIHIELFILEYGFPFFTVMHLNEVVFVLDKFLIKQIPIEDVFRLPFNINFPKWVNFNLRGKDLYIDLMWGSKIEWYEMSNNSLMITIAKRIKDGGSTKAILPFISLGRLCFSIENKPKAMPCIYCKESKEGRVDVIVATFDDDKLLYKGEVDDSIQVFEKLVSEILE